MGRSFIGKLSGLAALAGVLVTAILAASAYSLATAFHADDEALSMYAEELILGKSLGEATQRKLADSRAYLLARDQQAKESFERAARDEQAIMQSLRAHVKSAEGQRLLDLTAGDLERHDRALRSVMERRGSTDEVATAWSTSVYPFAVRLRQDIDAFIGRKRHLYDEAKDTAYRVQSRAVLVSASVAVAALIAGLFGGIYLLRSARATLELEAKTREATERERAFFTALLNHLPIGIIAAGVGGRILLVSEWARRLLADEPLATGTLSEFAEWPLERLDGTPYSVEDLPLSRALRGQVVHAEEIRVPSGRVFSVTAGPIRDQHGAIVAAACGFSDVTTRKDAEKERELFIGALGHDLRNPLSVISLAAAVLQRRGDLPEAAARPVARIASSAQRMNELIGELLDFAMSQHGELPIKPEPCRLRDVAGEVVAEIQAAHPDREIRIESQGGCEGRWDRARLAQVFHNLVGNAVQHGDPAQPIEIKTGGDGETAWAEVVNRGHTIPADERTRIFEPFQSIGERKGLGLGLYIARAIVVAHGGSIHLESGGGSTTFTVELPAVSDAPRERPRPSPERQDHV